MDWTEAISKAVQYIEDNITEDISARRRCKSCKYISLLFPERI